MNYLGYFAKGGKTKGQDMIKGIQSVLGVDDQQMAQLWQIGINKYGSEEGIAEAINQATQGITDASSPDEVKAAIASVFSTGSEMFRCGGKMQRLAERFAKGGKTNCGCGGIKMQMGGTVDDVLYAEDGTQLTRRQALDAAAANLYGGNRDLARTAYQNAKYGLRQQGLRGRALRQAARQQIAQQPIVEEEVPAVTREPLGDLTTISTPISGAVMGGDPSGLAGTMPRDPMQDINSMSFNDAFATARRNNKGQFVWHGKAYTTDYAPEPAEPAERPFGQSIAQHTGGLGGVPDTSEGSPYSMWTSIGGRIGNKLTGGHGALFSREAREYRADQRARRKAER